ncbi:hypothetical protein EV122DRAFT_265382 [Schizophyllum commune]
MLAQDPDNTNTMAKAGVTTVPIKPVDTVIQTGVDPVVPSMEGYDPLQADLGQLLSMGDSWAEQYLTASPTSMTGSPDDTPLNEFLSTPLFDDIHDPIIGGIDANMPLFGGSEVYTGDVLPSDDKMDAFPMGGLYTLSPSASPVDTIDPFATDFGANDAATPAPETPASNSGRRSSGRPSKSGGRRAQATGTRRNISVNQLVPLDAPTQTRNYLTDSATSRKEVPAVFAKKKRARSQAFPEEEEGAVDLSLSMTEREQIEAKRRQNTLAARKSRKRKLEHTQQLEASVQFLTEQLELWKGRATMLQGVCRDHGLPCPTFEDQ